MTLSLEAWVILSHNTDEIDIDVYSYHPKLPGTGGSNGDDCFFVLILFRIKY